MMANQDNLDHRSSDSDTQDPTSMTIEFLRARLLAERAVSKSARAKLNELSDKVAELEEQLKIVSLQRKKAEQATADVLAILEENGFNETTSDAYESDSGHDCYSRTNSVSGKSLSWKGRRREQDSSEKIKDSCNRRHRGFESAYFSSSRHRQGRSCRQIRRRESRIVSEDDERDVDFQENGVRIEHLPQTSEEASKTVVDVTVVKKKSISNGLEKVNSMDTSLERALENRAEVIGSFENMEETQKEWEKKFSENKSSVSQDLCDIGNHSDVTDESNAEKDQNQLQGSSLRETVSIANEADFRESFDTLSCGSPDNSVASPDNCGSKSIEHGASSYEDNGKLISESPKIESSPPQSCKGICEHSSSTILSPSLTRPKSRGGSICSSATTIQKVVPMTQEKSDTCGDVLTALKQAKLSLQEKVNSLHVRKPEYLSESSYPSTPVSYMNTLPIESAYGTRSSLPASSVGSMVEFPVRCAGLFRVPTDFSPDVSTRNNFLASCSQKALVSRIPELDIPLLPGDQLITNISTKSLLTASFQSQLQNTSPPLSMEDRPLITPYIGGPKLWTGFREDGQTSRLYKCTPSVSGSTISGGASGFEGNQVSSTSFDLDRKISTYTPPMTPTRSLYPDSVLRSREMHSTPYYTHTVGLPPTSGSDDVLFRRV